MADVSLTGQDSVTINGTILSTLADMTPFEITFPNDLGQVKTGKNGNTIYAKNEMGRVADTTLRILLAGADDQYLNGLLQQWISDPSTFTLITAMFVKRVGDGLGNITSKVYNCTGGFFKRQVDAKTSAESDTEQSVAIWRITYGNCQISIQ
jgi:hypothetical protein